MTTFILACAGLVLFSGLFYLLPSRRSGGVDEDLQRANVEWYRLRRDELTREGADALEEDARLRLLEDEQQARVPVASAGASQSFPAWVLLPLVALLSTGMYYVLGAAPDVAITRQLESLGEGSTPSDTAALMRAIETRSAQRPDNFDYKAMLARSYIDQKDYGRASRTYEELVRAFPEDPELLAAAGQADYLAADRQLNPMARARLDQALAINPHQRTALGVMGMAAFEQEQYRDALGYWQRLLAVEPPGSDSARMINSVMDMARQRLIAAGETVDDTPPGDLAQAGDPTPGVTVRVALPEGASTAPTDTVFVLARNPASGSRMPIAVQRLQAGQLPATLRLDDSNSMAGQKLSETESVVVVVQVSPTGAPGEASATWLGQLGPLTPSMDTAPRDIVLQPREGGATAASAAPATGGTAAATPGVTVRVALPAGVAVAATDTVFVLARNPASGSRMPIAVQRLQAGQLPATLRLDDSNSMAGQKLSETESVVVVVQVSPSGAPGEASATWLGELGPLAPSLDPAPHEILLQPKG